MKEKIYTTKKNGMAMLIMSIILYLAAIPVMAIGFISETAAGTILGIVMIIWLSLG